MTELRKIGFFLGLVLALVACGQIDDDLSDCPPPGPPTPIDPEEELDLNYELKLVTNMTTELKTQLNTVSEVEVSNALKDYLKGVFRDFAHDVDLSFYDVGLDSVRLHHESHIMNDSASSYTLNLPMREYMHLASANIIDNSLVSLLDDDRCHAARLSQLEGDTINSHETGVFSARANMDVLGDISQTFNVKLYMANAAAALVVDTTDVKIKGIRAYTRGFATDFHMADSAYVYSEQSPFVRASQMILSDTINQIAYCTVNFPSRNPNGWEIREKNDSKSGAAEVGMRFGRTAITRAEGEIIPSGTIDENSETLWEYIVFVTLEDGSITKTTLEMKEPLLAGEMKIVKGRMDTKGIVQPTDMKVGVSVMLNWNEGMEYNQEL